MGVADCASGQERDEMSKQMIGDLRPGEPIDTTFLVGEVSLRTSRNGSTYLTLQLRDRSGQIAARLWDATEALAGSIAADDFVHVKGRAESYQNQLQVIIRTLIRADTQSLRLGDFLPQSEHDVGEMMNELRRILQAVEDPDLKALLEAFLADEDFCAAFRTAPAAIHNHHSYLGGLLEHTLSMARVALKLLDHYTELRRDLFLAGVFLHDIGKIREISYRRAFCHTRPGELVGHVTLGVLMLEERARQLEDFPEDKLDMLRHMTLSHHGALEFGSPKLPMFAEAQALHYLDNLDAKLKDFSSIVAEDRNSDPEWTEYSRRLARRLYKR